MSHRFQRTKIDNDYSSWKEVISGVPRGSLLGQLFFNINLCDIFFIIKKFDIDNFAGDNTPYVTGGNISSVVKLLEEVACAIFQWFKDNELKANVDNYHVLLSTSNELTLNINEVQIKNSQSEKSLGITIDHDLKFEDHINNICGKASVKISALSRIASHMDLPKRKKILNPYFKFIYSLFTAVNIHSLFTAL